MQNYSEIASKVYNHIMALGLPIHPSAEALLKGAAGRRLMGMVEQKLIVAGCEPSETIDAMMAYAPSLAKSWPGREILADRVVKNYLSSGKPKDPSECPNDGPQDGDGGKGDKQGEGDGDGNGEGHEGKGDGDGNGEGHEGKGDGDGNGEGHEGKGDGDGNGEGHEGKGDGDGEGDDDPVPMPVPVPNPEPDPEPVPAPVPVPKPTPDENGYVKPREYNIIEELLLVHHFDVSAVGPAGCGKTEIGIHIAKNSSLTMEVISSPQAVHEIIGFMNAAGEFVGTSVTRAFENGGILIIDELDRGSPEAIIALNAGLANGYLSTPKGMIPRHPKLVVYATSNTAGFGADDEYTTANQLDASTRDRFVHIDVDYDINVDEACAGGDRALVEFTQEFRQAVSKAEVRGAVLSYRGVGMVHALWGNLKAAKEMVNNIVINGAVLKGQSRDNIMSIYDGLVNKRNKYAMAMKKYAESLPDDGGF